MRYTIDGEIAKQVGANGALIYAHITYWIERNRKAKKAMHKGEVWMFSSYSAIASHFGFITQHQVRRCLDELEKVGLVKSDTVGFNRTKWYTTTGSPEVLKNEVENAALPSGKSASCNWHTRQMHLANLPAPSGKSASTTLYKDYKKTIKKKVQKHHRPSLEELTEAFTERGHPSPGDIAQTFLDHYESNGWKVGRNTMKSWKGAVGTWMKRENEKHYAKSKKGFNGSNFTATAASDFITNG